MRVFKLTRNSFSLSRGFFFLCFLGFSLSCFAFLVPFLLLEPYEYCFFFKFLSFRRYSGYNEVGGGAGEGGLGRGTAEGGRGGGRGVRYRTRYRPIADRRQANILVGRTSTDKT
jgi:hypothetical protein